MATTARYLTSVKNLPAILQKIKDGVPPDKFNNDHLKAIGFSSSGDRALVPLLKDLGFLAGDGTPTQRYRDFRNSSRSRAVMAEALREAYSDVFKINEKISKTDRPAVIGLLKSLHDGTDAVANFQAMTFFALLDHADINATPGAAKVEENPIPEEIAKQAINKQTGSGEGVSGNFNMPLTYRFEIQLPATKDVEVFRAIFKAMKEELFVG